MSGKSGTGELAHEWAHLLKHELDLCDDAGRPVVFRIDREPAEHVRKLMATLGVRVEVRPVSQYVARSKQAKKKLVDNRTIVGQSGQVALACGHHVTGMPQLSNPDRWWCCGGWRTKR